MKRMIAVIGSADATPAMERAAQAVGKAIIDAGARLITGGRSGVMAAACRGARSSPEWEDGRIIAVLPGYSAAPETDADIVFPTGLGHARNVVIVACADLVVLVGGSDGAMSEAALAHKLNKPLCIVEGTGGVADVLGQAWGARSGVAVLDLAETTHWLRDC